MASGVVLYAKVQNVAKFNQLNEAVSSLERSWEKMVNGREGETENQLFSDEL